MKDVSVIQLNAERRRFDALAFRDRQAEDEENWALAERDLHRIGRLIDRYHLTQGENRD